MLADTLNHAITTTQHINNDIDLVSKIDNFYESAWNKLIYVVSTLLAVVGVVIPLIIQYWQNKKQKRNSDDLKAEIDAAVFTAKNEIKSLLDQEITGAKHDIHKAIAESRDELSKLMNLKISNKIADMDTKLKETENSIYARHFQMGAALSKNDNESFAMSIVAVEYYSLANESEGQIEILEHLVKSIPTTKVNKKDLKIQFEYFKIGIDTLYEIMKLDNSGVINKLIVKLLQIYEALPNEPIIKIKPTPIPSIPTIEGNH